VSIKNKIKLMKIMKAKSSSREDKQSKTENSNSDPHRYRN
jgi:hypothetical protein